MAARLCPHCGVVSNFSNHAGENGHWGPDKTQVRIEVWKCQNCDGVLSTIILRGGVQTELHAFPGPLPKVHTSVFGPASRDFVEAVQCLGVRAYKASSVMFRRALQQVMLDKQANGAHLIDQINDLAARGIISNDLANWSHEVRLWGNIGAHPNDDGLDELTEDDVVVAQTFLESLFEYCYVLPSTVVSSRVRRQNQTP